MIPLAFLIGIFLKSHFLQNDLLEEAIQNRQTTFHSIIVDGKEVEFSEGFTDLHTAVYREILAGRGFGIDAARPSIDLAYQIRNAHPQWNTGNTHDFLQNKEKSVND